MLEAIKSAGHPFGLLSSYEFERGGQVKQDLVISEPAPLAERDEQRLALIALLIGEKAIEVKMAFANDDKVTNFGILLEHNFASYEHLALQASEDSEHESLGRFGLSRKVLEEEFENFVLAMKDGLHESILQVLG